MTSMMMTVVMLTVTLTVFVLCTVLFRLMASKCRQDCCANSDWANQDEGAALGRTPCWRIVPRTVKASVSRPILLAWGIFRSAQSRGSKEK